MQVYDKKLRALPIPSDTKDMDRIQYVIIIVHNIYLSLSTKGLL